VIRASASPISAKILLVAVIRNWALEVRSLTRRMIVSGYFPREK
jgi:hypothetical protein